MPEQISWYLIVSSFFLFPAFIAALILWWKANAATRDKQVFMTKLALSLMFLWVILFMVFLSGNFIVPYVYHKTFQMVCRWGGEAFAVLTLGAAIRGHGWMRIVLVATAVWLFAASFWLLHPAAF